MSEPVTVIINNRNLHTWPKAMVDCVLRFASLHEIIILDNDSTFEPTLRWYADLELYHRHSKPRVSIHYLRHNVGHTAPWLPEVLEKVKTDWYVVTDPDLDLSQCPTNTLEHLQHCLQTHPKALKVGLALRINDVPCESPYYRHTQIHEGWTWHQPVQDNSVRRGNADTTFAIYNKQILSEYKLAGIRTIEPYVARHLPWYIIKPDTEFQYYLDHATNSSSYRACLPNFRDTETAPPIVSPFRPYRLTEMLPPWAKHLQPESADFANEAELRAISFLIPMHWQHQIPGKFMYARMEDKRLVLVVELEKDGKCWVAGTLNQLPPWIIEETKPVRRGSSDV